METQTCNYVPCGCPVDSPCECTFTKNAAGKQLRKFDCSLRGLTTLKGLDIWKEADYFDLSINKIWNGGEVAMLSKSLSLELISYIFYSCTNAKLEASRS